MPRTFTRQCPHCTRQATWPDTPTYPFCSERCQLIDLGAWASGEYRIPGEPVLEEEDWPATDVADGDAADVC
ncbi:MAG: DNA gyrase inhibitor YacG [Candidatus Tectomicrobia bacterium]|uniref:DNA gyrase inhibitor YacG n=1 Tax=Tectimicrobiota bacterium TaxID=2528274 RepID=A0A938B147_UNCTE|nr:DNA gyrase inhibitor YacG [Candidatus Tectomicrobia bacterium]